MDQYDRLRRTFATNRGIFRATDILEYKKKNPILQVETFIGNTWDGMWIPFNELTAKDWDQFIHTHKGKPIGEPEVLANSRTPTPEMKHPIERRPVEVKRLADQMSAHVDAEIAEMKVSFLSNVSDVDNFWASYSNV